MVPFVQIQKQLAREAWDMLHALRAYYVLTAVPSYVIEQAYQVQRKDPEVTRPLALEPLFEKVCCACFHQCNKEYCLLSVATTLLKRIECHVSELVQAECDRVQISAEGFAMQVGGCQAARRLQLSDDNAYV